MGETLSDDFTNVTGTGPITLSAGGGGKGAVGFGDSGNNEVTGTAGRDAVEAGAGDDNLDGGGGADRLEGGTGDDVIKGGSDGSKFRTDESGNQIIENGSPVPLEVWEWGDRAVFKGKKSDFTITSNSDGTFTVKDNNTSDGDEGTDTLSGIEIIEFNDSNELLVTKLKLTPIRILLLVKQFRRNFPKVLNLLML